MLSLRKKSFFQIEYILIFVAVFNFTSTEILKRLTLQRFDNGELELTLSQQREYLLGYDSLLYFSLILVTIAMAVIIHKRVSQKAELERLKAVNEEQISFSRNLHDTVAQDLAAVKFQIQKGDYDKAELYADQALSEVRYMIDSLHTDLQERLTDIIRETLLAFEDNYHIKSELYIYSDNIEKIRADYKIQLIHIIKEALSNIARHAQATLVQIKIADLANNLHISISDNGLGFDFKDAMQKSDKDKKHWGLKNICDRVSQMDGQVDFINNGGTTIAITLKNPLS